jgi:hypothetical protein
MSARRQCRISASPQGGDMTANTTTITVSGMTCGGDAEVAS